MNRNQAKQLLPIIQAFSEGKCVEAKTGSGWISIENMSFAGNPDSYRIQPEPKYRPFENGKECLKEMKKHEPFGWVKSEVFDYAGAISSVSNELGNLCVCNSYVTFKEGFNNYTFFDDTPFGIKEEE